jgi:hypothetical protein
MTVDGCDGCVLIGKGRKESKKKRRNAQKNN